MQRRRISHRAATGLARDAKVRPRTVLFALAFCDVLVRQVDLPNHIFELGCPVVDQRMTRLGTNRAHVVAVNRRPAKVRLGNQRRQLRRSSRVDDSFSIAPARHEQQHHHRASLHTTADHTRNQQVPLLLTPRRPTTCAHHPRPPPRKCERLGPTPQRASPRPPPPRPARH